MVENQIQRKTRKKSFYRKVKSNLGLENFLWLLGGSNPGRFGPIPVRSGRFGPGRFGPISGVSRFGPVGAGRFGPISSVGRFGPIFGASRFGLIYL